MSSIVDTPLGTSFIADTPSIVDTPLFQGTAIKGTAFIADTPSFKGTSFQGTAFIADTPSLEQLYIASLDEMDKIALNVARTTMGSLFSLSKSTAFIEWTNERNKKQMDV
jgi:hypothetical protein